MDSFSVSTSQKKHVHEAFDLLLLQNHFCPEKLYFALNIACSLVARSFQTANINDPSKSDQLQARAAASDQEADGKQSAKLLQIQNISLICTSLVHHWGGNFKWDGEAPLPAPVDKAHTLHGWWVLHQKPL